MKDIMSKQPTFLYIEDHPASRRIMQILLLDVMDYSQLTLVEDTAELTQRLEAIQTSFDVIFLDINVKPYDGFAACAQLRAHEQFRKAKIIGLTANAMPSDMRKMEETGFDGAIGKPLSHNTFPEQVERILAGQSIWEAA
jgi:CheY-like chemotaxis protein